MALIAPSNVKNSSTFLIFGTTNFCHFPNSRHQKYLSRTMNSNSCDCNPNNRTTRSDPSRTPANRAPTAASRSGGVSINRTPVYINDAAINSMLAKSQFLPHYFSSGRMPTPMSRQTPGQYSTSSDPEAFGQQLDYNMGWMMPKDVNVADLVEQGQIPPGHSEPPQAPGKDSRFLLGEERDPGNIQVGTAKQESLIEWFDRTVEKELRKRRDSGSSSPGPSVVDPALASQKALHKLNMSKGTLEKLGEASASGIEIDSQMRMEPDTALTDAVDKLAKAEAMCAFAGAVKAAEAATIGVSPDLAEAAAVAATAEFETEAEAQNEIHNPVTLGTRPVEVIGYVGVTKPRHPKQS